MLHITDIHVTLNVCRARVPELIRQQASISAYKVLTVLLRHVHKFWAELYQIRQGILSRQAKILSRVSAT